MKQSIKFKIDRLSLQQRRQLSHAFDCEIPQFVSFGNNEFVGVHLNFARYRHLQVIDQVGVWSYGTIKIDLNNPSGVF